MKHEGFGGGEEIKYYKHPRHYKHLVTHSIVGSSISGASDDVIEISSLDEEPSDRVAKPWLGFLDLTTPEPEEHLPFQKKNGGLLKSLI